ncbi:MAG: hypothetical protein K2Y32_14115 [Candidatus Obscuribacterales bacterium]|nr:hypothetical protein [Candidatus Obscuribacterales bacterium]
MTEAGVSKQRELFEKLHNEARLELSTGRYGAVLDRTKDKVYSLVGVPAACRSLEDLSTELAAELKQEFPELAVCESLVYDPESFHFTLFGLPGYVKQGALARHLDRILASSCAAVREPLLSIAGVSIVGGAIVAPLLDLDGRLTWLVNTCLDELFEELGDEVGELLNDAQLHRSIFWITLARPCRLSIRLFERIEKLSSRFVEEKRSGKIEFEAVSIVQTDKQFSKAGTEVIKSHYLSLLT